MLQVKVESTASDTSIIVKNEVKLPREVKGNVWFICVGQKGLMEEFLSMY
jgi:hypothetical protein